MEQLKTKIDVDTSELYDKITGMKAVTNALEKIEGYIKMDIDPVYKIAMIEVTIYFMNKTLEEVNR